MSSKHFGFYDEKKPLDLNVLDRGDEMWKWIAVLPLGLFGCSEYGLDLYGGPQDGPDEETAEAEIEEDDCVQSETDFDIEEVSTLQDAFGLPSVRDGLTLEVGEHFTKNGRTWRPVGVEVLVMYPDWYFDFYEDSNTIQVSVYDSATPEGSTPFKVSQRIEKSALKWGPLRLPAEADWSADNRDQMAAWVYFDFSDLTPLTGFNSDRYFVAVEWDAMGFPNVGYSNFELSCQQNWTDYGAGTWKQNTGDDCSWPMFKIDVETRTEGDDCD